MQPVAAETITTDAKDSEAGEIKMPVKDGEMPAYRAMPMKGGPFPVVLVVQEIFGVHEHIKDICRRFAKLGYLAIAPELYARQGDVSKIPEIKDVIAKVVSKVPDEQVMGDLDAAVAWAKESGKGDTSKLGITGFLLGRAHRLVVFAAQQARRESRRCLVRPSGEQAGRVAPEEPGRPGRIAHAPAVLGLYGAADQASRSTRSRK